ncbi:MAG: DNA alkylation repair protein [Deltaproteobacteria bacterium]|nr:DNA alkylation repair protein [Deltaproteobacteria bacterium]
MKPEPSVEKWLGELARRLAQIGDMSRAEAQKAYMKSELDFLGVSQPDVRKIASELVKSHSDMSHPELLQLARASFSSRSFDLRSVAIGVLEKKKKTLEADDLELLVGLVRTASCWAHVDWLATKVAPAVLGKRDDAKVDLRRWAVDSSFWVRRTALLAQLDELRAGRGDFELFEEIAVPMLPEKEFFIRKAIGWVLRETSRKRPKLIRDFVKKHEAQMSGLTKREATKHLRE